MLFALRELWHQLTGADDRPIAYTLPELDNLVALTPYPVTDIRELLADHHDPISAR